MVDINLIGDDQTQFEDDDNEKDFQDTYSSDANELNQDSYMRGETIDNSEYAKVLRRGRSKVGVYILFFVVIIILAITVYILFIKPQKTVTKKQPGIESIADTGITDDTSFTEQPVTSAESDFETTTPTTTTAALSPSLREKITHLNRAVNTIVDIMNGIPSNVNFTMISYSNGKFLFELLSQEGDDLSQISSMLEQSITSADVQIVSQDIRYISGRKFNQALVSGSVGSSQSMQRPGAYQRPAFLSVAEFQQQLTSISAENGLTIKQFDDGIEKTESNFILTPIIFRASGLKGSIESMLRQLVSANLNVTLNKISLISNDVDLSSPYITLVLNITLYQNI